MSRRGSGRRADRERGGAGWFDQPRNIARLVHALYAACALLLVAGLFAPKYGPFAIEHWPGFHAVAGLVACAALVLAGHVLRRLLLRPEDYYDR